MLETIKQAAKNFCLHQLQKPCQEASAVTDKGMLIAYIDIETKDKKYRVYIGAQKELVQQVAQLFLEETQSDYETLADMLLELTNLIVGSAKVLAEQKSTEAFSITTPILLNSESFDVDVDKEEALLIGNSCLKVALKELNG